MQLLAKIKTPICQILSQKVFMAHLDYQLSYSYDFMSILFVRSLNFVDNLQLCISGFIVRIKVGAGNSEDNCIARVIVLFLNSFINKS